MGRRDGHVLKVRYTSIQTDTGSAEEHMAARCRDRPRGMPVVVCGLHSQLAPVAAAISHGGGRHHIAYVMTDVAALPLALSDSCSNSAPGLLDVTVTAGQAFGGEVEAVNVPSALCLAPPGGPTSPSWPWARAGWGPARSWVSAPSRSAAPSTRPPLGGTPIACVRYTTANGRPRHDGVSHHTLTALGRAGTVRSCAGARRRAGRDACWLDCRQRRPPPSGRSTCPMSWPCSAPPASK